MISTREIFITRAKDEIIQFFANAPSQDEIVSFHFSEDAEEELHDLMSKNNQGTISKAEKELLIDMVQMNHLLTMIRLKILVKRKEANE